MTFTLTITLPDEWTNLHQHDLGRLVTNVAARVYDGSLGGNVMDNNTGKIVGRFDVKSETELRIEEERKNEDGW